MRKRKNRRNRGGYRNRKANMTAASVLMIVCFSVLAGYVTATYIIGPALGLESQPAFFDFIKDDNKTVKNTDSNEKDVNENRNIVEDQIEVDIGNGFALQYGSFSSREGAKQCVRELQSKEIEAQIVEKDGSFKVISRLFDTKEEARNYMESSSIADDEVFITEIP